MPTEITTPANTYFSAISQEAANQLAIDAATALCPAVDCPKPESGHVWTFNYAITNSTGGGSGLFTGDGAFIDFVATCNSGTGTSNTFMLADTGTMPATGTAYACKITTEILSISNALVAVNVISPGGTGTGATVYSTSGTHVKNFSVLLTSTLRIQVQPQAGSLGVFPNIVPGNISGTITIGGA